MTTCWSQAAGKTIVSPSFACGAPNSTSPFVNCCWRGDFCLSDNICHYTHAQPNGSSYYIAGCTDPNFQDPSCSQQCRNNWWPDIVYKDSTSLWACCTTYENNTKICQQRTDDTWQAPAPSKLATIGSIPATGQSFTTPTSTATSSATSASAPGLTTGAQAGIGVGAAVGALILITLAVFLFRRASRKRRQKTAAELDNLRMQQPYSLVQQTQPEMVRDNISLGYSGKQKFGVEQYHEIPEDRQRHELI